MKRQNLSPLIACDIVCSDCGDTVHPLPVKNRNGEVETMEYTHHNNDSGCRWIFRSKVYASGMMTPLRADGSESKL